MDPMLLQVGIAAPLVLALIVFTARQQDRSGVHRSLAWLLTMMLAWMVGMLLAPNEGAAPLLVRALLIPPSCFMAPLFLLVMLQYTRVELFEQRSGARWALLAPFWVFFAAFATHDWHGLMTDMTRSQGGVRVVDTAGPLFWAFQVWSNAVAITGIGICVRTGWQSSSRAERRRMWLLCVGATVPLLAHVAHMFRLIPTEYPLTPAALAVTSLCIVAAIRRYKLLDVQPIARRDVLEASSDAVIVADVDGVVVDMNPAAAKLLGSERGRLCGNELGATMQRLGRTEPVDALASMLGELRAGRTPARVEVETEDGRVLEVAAGVPNDATGTRAGSFVVVRDRSGERRAERLLHQRQKLESVGILAAGIAHEVNNPLAFVRANIEHLRHAAELLEDELDLLPKHVADELRDLPEVIEESISGLSRIQRIVQGLVRFSRMPTGHRGDCDANEAVLEASRFASLDRAATVRFDTRLDADLPHLLASPDQLVQVLLNLFLNARRALEGRDDPRVEVTTGVKDGFVEIRVADNGPGIPEAIRDKIFDPFFTTRAPGEGTGLGLAIAFDIIREHDGVLELDSPPGGGACFVVRLPIALAG
jgi:PAS domain S-box-containing protein